MSYLPPLSDVARLSLSIGRLFMESGESGRVIHEEISGAACALGCDSAEVYCQHAAIIVTSRRGEEFCVQMGKVGEHGVNLRRSEGIRNTLRRVASGDLECSAAQIELDVIPHTIRSYPVWLVCLCTGLACGAFGRLFGVDWPAFVPVHWAATGQWIRHALIVRKQNIFITAGIVSFCSAFFNGLGCPAFREFTSCNCHGRSCSLACSWRGGVEYSDGCNRRKTEPCRRSWSSRDVSLGLHDLGACWSTTFDFARNVNTFWIHLFHQAFFGGIAAAGFGILFNCPPRMILQCFCSGAVALAVRTAGQAANLNLAEASFFAALVVATAERVLQQFQSSRGSILSLVGCIPMVPGSIAPRGLMNLYALLRAHPNEEILAAADGMRNLLEVTFTLAAIGTALAIPRLIYPKKTPQLR